MEEGSWIETDYVWNPLQGSRPELRYSAEPRRKKQNTRRAHDRPQQTRDKIVSRTLKEETEYVCGTCDRAATVVRGT